MDYLNMVIFNMDKEIPDGKEPLHLQYFFF